MGAGAAFGGRRSSAGSAWGFSGSGRLGSVVARVVGRAGEAGLVGGGSAGGIGVFGAAKYGRRSPRRSVGVLHGPSVCAGGQEGISPADSVRGAGVCPRGGECPDPRAGGRGVRYS